MTPAQVIKYYGSITKATKALGFKNTQRISNWKAKGFVPARMQASIAGYTNNELKVGPPLEGK